MNYTEAVLLGALQGVAEWLPVSSEGLVTATYSLIAGRSLSESVGISLWLHIGTAFAALAAFRAEVRRLVGALFSSPLSLDPVSKFVVMATLVSAPIGMALLLGLEEFSQVASGLAMAAVGLLMMVTAGVLYRGQQREAREREEAGWLDAVLAGFVQGLAASGLTLAVLLGRGIDRRDAITLSFLMSIPVSVGAGLYAGIRTSAHSSPESVVALVVAALVGFVSIRTLIALAGRVNFGWFVAIAGVVIIAGGFWQALG
ncbi:MAG: undecaprenyl-diphosphate phosphatase [Dehalococcoidia bacterium]|nr:undecaprenyl-diphosphate phosphatase [Dehalococcoidia bacterium]